MDPAIISALSAVLGSLVGGTASITTAWFTQRSQGRRERALGEVRKREEVYTAFIGECSKLSLDALDKSLDNPAILVEVYALQNRIRLTGSDAVVLASEQTVRRIVDQYLQPNVSLLDLYAQHRRSPDEVEDPIRPFSLACRLELRQLMAGS